jgi:D-glycero-alpha-D-manno-heptose 1-phosphate guanylyltransferase
MTDLIEPSVLPSRDDAASTKAVLLVGGQGTRLRSVLPSVPKPLAPVGDRPFLELLIRQLKAQGIRQLVMCTGYLADDIENKLGTGQNLGVTIEYSRERQSLGTAGAIKLAKTYLHGLREFVVMNGDSFLEVDIHQLLDFHHSHGGVATVAVVEVENAGRYGTVCAEASHRVTAFCEKTGNSTPGLINAGVYVFSRALLDHIPVGTVSLEKEVFPKLLEHGIYAFELSGMFIDIGTPSDYARAQEMFDRLSQAANLSSSGS